MDRLTKSELAIGKLLYPERSLDRPVRRGECANVVRPCPFVGCRHHLFLDVNFAGNIIVNLPGEPWDAVQSCALDVADDGGKTLDEVGRLMQITRERARQIQTRAAEKLLRRMPKDLRDGVRQMLSEGGGENI